MSITGPGQWPICPKHGKPIAPGSACADCMAGLEVTGTWVPFGGPAGPVALPFEADPVPEAFRHLEATS